VHELEQQQEQLTQSEQNLRAKIEQFRTKKEVIKAQYSAAEAQVRISEAATGVGNQMADVGLAMQRAIDKTEQMKARAGAVQELEAAGTFEDLTAIGPGEDDIDRQLRELSSTSAVDSELAQLKSQLAGGAQIEAAQQPVGELGAGTGPDPGASQAPAQPADAGPQFDEAQATPAPDAASGDPDAPAPEPEP
jgi:phage shock protein A